MALPTDMNTEPKIANIRVRGKWTGGVQTEVNIRNFPPVVMDEPPDLGGTDKGPNPMEYVLGALIGCETVLVAVVAQEKGFEYTGLEFDLRGSLDIRGLEGVEGVRPYFDTIKGTINVTTSESEADLMTLAKEVERRCPAYTMLEAAGVTFDVKWRIVQP